MIVCSALAAPQQILEEMQPSIQDKQCSFIQVHCLLIEGHHIPFLHPASGAHILVALLPAPLVAALPTLLVTVFLALPVTMLLTLLVLALLALLALLVRLASMAVLVQWLTLHGALTPVFSRIALARPLLVTLVWLTVTSALETVRPGMACVH